MEPPTLTSAKTDGITYTTDLRRSRTCRCRQTVMVTATLTDTGVGWPATMPRVDRDESDDGDVPVMFAYGGVYPVAPADPMVMQATCTDW